MKTNSSHKLAKINITGALLVAPDPDSKVAKEDYLAAFVAKYGPVSINVDAMAQLWQPYKGGIVSGCCNKATDHAVLIVGYGQGADSKGVQTPYWLIKNSWNMVLLTRDKQPISLLCTCC